MEALLGNRLGFYLKEIQSHDPWGCGGTRVLVADPVSGVQSVSGLTNIRQIYMQIQQFGFKSHKIRVFDESCLLF